MPPSSGLQTVLSIYFTVCSAVFPSFRNILSHAKCESVTKIMTKSSQSCPPNCPRPLKQTTAVLFFERLCDYRNSALWT